MGPGHPLPLPGGEALHGLMFNGIRLSRDAAITRLHFPPKLTEFQLCCANKRLATIVPSIKRGLWMTL